MFECKLEFKCKCDDYRSTCKNKCRKLICPCAARIPNPCLEEQTEATLRVVSALLKEQWEAKNRQEAEEREAKAEAVKREAYAEAVKELNTIEWLKEVQRIRSELESLGFFFKAPY